MDVIVLIEGPGKAPVYATEGAAGADLAAALDAPVELAPGERRAVGTGIRLAIPPGYEGHVRPRSGLFLRHGVAAFPGTVDSDYRGEIRVILQNTGDAPYRIEPGERIAQIVFSRTERAAFRRGSLDDTPRGDGGFGHTGRR